jgi:hypothetical protein
MAIINGRGRVGIRPTSGSGTPSYDADAQAFFTAASITDPTQMGAVNTLVTGLKSNNLWTKMKAIYPVVGGNATAHSKNLKNPSQYNLTFTSGWIHSSTGMLPNGTSAYADTNLTPSANLSQNNNHISYYSRTQTVANGVEIRSSNSGNQHVLDIEIYFGGRWYTNNCGYNSSTPETTTTGLFTCNRISSTQYKGFRNGTIEQTNNASSTGLSNKNIYIGAGNDGSSANWFSTKECAFSTIGDGFSDSEATTFYNLVQAFQTTLGRQV